MPIPFEPVDPVATFGTYDDPFLTVISSAPFYVDTGKILQGSKLKGLLWLLLLAILFGFLLYKSKRK